MKANPLEEILTSWRNGRSALLYGPPGTGKTRILTELWQAIESGAEHTGQLGFDANNARNPFQPVTVQSGENGPGLPQPASAIWMTFHQSLGYEDFIIGHMPRSTGQTITLAPQAGTLLEAIMELQSGVGAKSIVLFIDEINRGNASKIFGEFLTFLDFEYRETHPDGTDNKRKVPLPIRQLGRTGTHYEPVRRQDGSEYELSFPSYFPRHIYVVATMNSVDRTAIPIDSALARRFDRIEIRPDVHVLADLWHVDIDSLGAASDNPLSMSAAQAAILILDRVNLTIAENFGSDFELGHGLLLGLHPTDDDAWQQLARVWDQILYPQIEDRFSSRPEALNTLLRVDEFASTPKYAWRYRESLTGQQSTLVIAPVNLSTLSPESIKNSFQALASRATVQ